jgi:protein TonB
MAQHFDAIVVDCDNEQNATLLFKSARNSSSNQSALAVAVVEGQSGVAKAFRIGANLVLTKPINVEQSKGTLRVARGLLRKADSSKPAANPAPVAAVPTPTFKAARPVAPASLASKPAFNGFPAQRTPIEATVSDKTSSAFELQQDPTPRPEPTEAALLESMSDSIESKRLAQPAIAPSPSKEYPWQPVSKPQSEPMASALKRAAEAVGKSEPAIPAASKFAVPRAAAHSTLAGHGAASAPAPAREIPQLSIQNVEPVLSAVSANELDQIEIAPAFGTVSAASEDTPEPLLFSGMQDEKKMAGAGGNKKIFAIGALAMVAIAGVYYHFSEHPESAPAFVQKIVNKQPAAEPVQTHAAVPAPIQPSISAQPSVPASTIVTPTNTDSQAPDSDAANSSVDNTETTVVPAHSTSEPKPSAGKSTSVVASNVKATNSTTAPESKVITVTKSGSVPKTQAPAPEIVQPPAPLALGSGSADKALAGIASTAGTAVPKPASAGTLKISQGVTQGLLIKKISPVYPQSAKQMHIQGSVELQANIGKDGNVTNVKALKGDAGLARAAIDAVKQWKYKPYTLNDEPVEIQTQITVNFRLP